jgi:hypothetical protein
MQNEAFLKAAMKVADAKTNLAVSIAEASKTADLVLGKATQLYQAYSNFRKGNLKKVANILNISPKKVHKTWLEYKYGWMPLLMDVRNSAEFLAQHQEGRANRFVVSATSKGEATYFTSTPDATYSPGSYYEYFATGSKTYKVKIWCEISNPRLAQLQQLGLTNPALVAWELIPFSFVFDWLCSVGDYLTGVTAFHGITVRKAMVSRLRDWSGNYHSVARSYLTPGGGQFKSGYDFVHKVKGRRYTRDAFSVNVLDLYPPVQNPFSWSHLTSGLALIRAQGKKLG